MRTKTLSIEVGKTYFYALPGCEQPATITLLAADDTTVTYMAESGADLHRRYTEPRWLAARAIEQGTSLARVTIERLIPDLTHETALFCARLISVVETQAVLTPSQAERCGQRVEQGRHTGYIVHAHRGAGGTWRYNVAWPHSGYRSTLQAEQFKVIEGWLPEDAPSAPPAPTEPPEETPVEPQPLMLPDFPPAAAPAERSSYKGHPTLTLTLDNGKTFSFGKSKAQAILQNLADILAFAAEEEAEDSSDGAAEAEPDAQSQRDAEKKG